MDRLSESRAIAVRGNAVTSFIRRAVGALTRSADSGPSIDSKGPFNTPPGAWSMVSTSSPTSYERVGRNIRVKGFESNAVVAACIRTVADLIGPVRLELHRLAADGTLTPDLTNPGQRLLDAPSAGWSRLRAMQTTAGHIIGYGNAYWVFDRNGVRGLPQSFRLVHPERIQYVYLDPETLEPKQYDWVDRNGRLHKSAWEDVVHFKDLTLDPDMLFGFPRGAAALLDIATDGEASQYIREIVTNYGVPGLIISMEGITSEGQARQADARFHEQMLERGERGRTRFLPNVKQVWELGQTLRELEFPDLRQVSREDICAAFGVDPRMISIASAKGTETGLSGAQYTEARRRLYLQTGAPLMTSIESELDLAFCPEFGENVRARFAPEEIAEITENEEETSVRVTREWQAGLVSLEEARAKRKLPAKMKPTDHQYLPLGGTILPVALQLEGGLDAQPAAAGPDGAPGQDAPGGASGGPAAGNQDAQSGPGAARQTPPSAARQIRSRILRRGQRAVALTEEQRTALWQDFDQRATRAEGVYRRTAGALFASEREGVRAVFAHAAGAGSRSIDGPDDAFVSAALRQIQTDYARTGDYHAAWLDRYRSLIGETFRVAGSELATSVGVSFDLENPRVQDAIRARATRLADHVTDTTAAQITAAIAAGQESGMGIRDIADLVDESVFAGAAPARAVTIARTESAGALNQGEYESAAATGVLQSHAWLSMRDGDVRDSHVECDAEGFIALGQAFANGLQYPGDPAGDAEDVINCRCAQLFSDEAPDGS